jgi:SAM-dependent methyltransferase
MLTVYDWHRRFQVQAGWNKSTRVYLFQKLQLVQSKNILEVGCGTGAILSYSEQDIHARIFGLDIQLKSLEFAKSNTSKSLLTCGNGLRLPFKTAVFDHVLCHLFLLWVTDPKAALSEMMRVSRRGGYVVALAEPDYGGRIDYPEELYELGCCQEEALRKQGADTRIGRKLASLFVDAGFENVNCGLVGGQWGSIPQKENLESEWEILNSDLTERYSRLELERLRKIDFEAWETGKRVLFVPTFYAYGRVP